MEHHHHQFGCEFFSGLHKKNTPLLSCDAHSNVINLLCLSLILRGVRAHRPLVCFLAWMHAHNHLADTHTCYRNVNLSRSRISALSRFHTFLDRFSQLKNSWIVFFAFKSSKHANWTFSFPPFWVFERWGRCKRLGKRMKIIYWNCAQVLCIRHGLEMYPRKEMLCFWFPILPSLFLPLIYPNSIHIKHISFRMDELHRSIHAS